MKLDRRLLQLARLGSGWLILSVGLGVSAGGVTIWQAGLLSRVIARSFLERASLAELSGLLALWLGAACLRQLCAWGADVAGNALAWQVKTVVRQRLSQRLLALGPLGLRGEQTGELSSLALEGIDGLEAYFSQYLPGIFLAALTPLLFLVFIFPIDPLSGVVLLVTAPLIPLFMVLIGGWSQSLTRRQWQSLSRMSAYFLDVIQGLSTLKLLGRSRAQVQGIAQTSERFRQATMGVLRVSFLSALALEMIATLSTAIVAVEIGLRLLYGRMSFEPAFFILVLAPEFYLPLRQLGARFHAGMSGAAAAQRLFTFLDVPVTSEGEVPSPLPPAPLIWTPDHSPNIQVDGVHFSYAGMDGGEAEQPAALAGVSLDLPAGRVTALVGPSGSGKSTLAALLLGLAVPATGRILVDGQDLALFSMDSWRQGIAWVPQNPYLFSGSVAENLRMARPQASLEELQEAARLAEAHDFIQALPKGYDTPLGERGARLSGGQAQRLALARAFLRRAPLIILDEPTAHLDSESEAAVQAALARLMTAPAVTPAGSTPTVLVIAHRLNTVRQAHQIVVLEHGQVADAGSHADLLNRSDLYRRMLEELPGAPESSLPPRPGLPQGTLPSPQKARKKKHTVDSSPYFETPGRPLLRLLALLRPFKGLVLLSMLAGATTVLSGVGLMSTSAFILSAAALHPSIAAIQTAIVGVRFFGITRGVFRYAERYLSHQVTFHLLAELRVRFYQALEPLAPARLSGRHSGDLLARILGDIAALENFYVRAVAPPGAALLSAAGVCLLLGRFDPRLALVWLMIFAVAGVGLPAWARRRGRQPGRRLAAERAAFSTYWVEGLQGLPDLLVYGRGQAWVDGVDKRSSLLGLWQQRLADLAAQQNALVSWAGQLSLWLALILAIPAVSAGRLEGVYLATLALAALTGFEAAAPLPLAGQYLEGSLQSARRLFEIIAASAEVVDPPEPPPLPERNDLRVSGVWFRYPPVTSRSRPRPSPHSSAAPGAEEDPQPWVLQDISFDLPPGKRMALVGPSGAGKSTLAALLLRFWEYPAGEICLGGVDLRQLEQEAVRSCLAVAPQQTYLFSASVRDNLRLVAPQASQAEIEQAARLAQLHERILALPQGYDTWVGEHGLRLSGGERQRLALARALLRPAPILVLDEPAAHLDPLTERDALQSILEHTRGRALLLITHRLVAMEAMDEILVLQAGRIVERGRHADLLTLNGLYRRLWENL